MGLRESFASQKHALIPTTKSPQPPESLNRSKQERPSQKAGRGASVGYLLCAGGFPHISPFNLHIIGIRKYTIFPTYK